MRGERTKIQEVAGILGTMVAALGESQATGPKKWLDLRLGSDDHPRNEEGGSEESSHHNGRPLQIKRWDVTMHGVRMGWGAFRYTFTQTLRMT